MSWALAQHFATVHPTCALALTASRQVTPEPDLSVYKTLTDMVTELINGEGKIYLVNWKVAQKNI